jgi:diacylglycerol kinase (ATP)
MRLFKSFEHAFRGFRYCVINERNMRVHTVVGMYALVFSCFFGLSKTETAVLFMMVMFVLAAEMLNTAVEGLSDIFVSEYSATARTIKDIAAGAVLVSSVAAVVVGLIFFTDVDAYVRIFNFFVQHYWLIGVFVISLVFSCCYIFWGPLEFLSKIDRATAFFRKKHSGKR